MEWMCTPNCGLGNILRTVWGHSLSTRYPDCGGIYWESQSSVVMHGKIEAISHSYSYIDRKHSACEWSVVILHRMKSKHTLWNNVLNQTHDFPLESTLPYIEPPHNQSERQLGHVASFILWIWPSNLNYTHSLKSIPIRIRIQSWIPNLDWNSKLNTDLIWNSKLNCWSVGRVQTGHIFGHSA